MNKIRIVEVDDNGSFPHEPLSYRITLTPRFNGKQVFQIKREYFRVGFRTGDSWDKIFWDFDKNGSSNGIIYASYMTRSHKDKDKLSRIEQQMIKGFVEKCYKSIELVEKKRELEYNRHTKRINTYTNIIKSLDIQFRKEKIEKIKKTIQDKE